MDPITVNSYYDSDANSISKISSYLFFTLNITDKINHVT